MGKSTGQAGTASIRIDIPAHNDQLRYWLTNVMRYIAANYASIPCDISFRASSKCTKPNRSSILSFIVAGIALSLLIGCEGTPRSDGNRYGGRDLIKSEASIQGMQRMLLSYYGTEDEIPESVIHALDQIRRLRFAQNPDAIRDANHQLYLALEATGDRCTVRISSSQPGATVRYRPVLSSETQTMTATRPSNDAEITVSIGNYYIWTVRDGNPTSDPNAVYPIHRREDLVDIVEREGARK